MTKNIIVTCVVSCDLFNKFVSFKAEITPSISETELFRMKAQSKLTKAIAGFKEWKKEFFSLEGFDSYNFHFD